MNGTNSELPATIQELISDLAGVTVSIWLALRRHGSKTLNMGSHKVLGERILQVCEGLQSLSELAEDLDEEVIQELVDLSREANMIAAEIK